MAAGKAVLQEVEKKINAIYEEVRLMDATSGVLLSRGHLEASESGAVKYVIDSDVQTITALNEEKEALANV